MHFKSGSRYLLRVFYYGRRISLECHHALETAPAAYACCRQSPPYISAFWAPTYPTAISVLNVDEEPDPEELEDAYMRYANAPLCPPPRPAEKDWVRGTKEPFHTFNIIDGICPKRR